MKWLLIAAGIVALAAIIGSVFVRSVDHDPAQWHVDPETVTEVQTRNQFLGSNTYKASREEVAAAVERSLGGDVLAGSYAEGWVTVVTRSALMGFPDYVSVRISEEGDGTVVKFFSRSRFGHSDLGANRARFERVLTDVKAALIPST